jgi:GNAT superfamily N-acetyltransferase
MIRPAAGDADLELCVRVLAAVDDVQLSIDQLRPVLERLLVHDSGSGYAFVNDSSVAGSAYAMVRVHPSARGRGVGSELATAAADAARGLGKESAWGVVGPDDPVSLRFAEARGFREVGRDVKLTRRLSPGDGRVHTGICELEEGHRREAYAVAVAAIPDMVTAGQAEARPYEEWVKQELDDAAVVFGALVEGRVVGYATLQPLGDDPTRLEHGFTGVHPEYRRRGIATALGDAQLAWAAARGYEELFTTTGVTNTGLRRQKSKLGYVEEAGPVLVRGPV